MVTFRHFSSIILFCALISIVELYFIESVSSHEISPSRACTISFESVKKPWSAANATCTSKGQILAEYFTETNRRWLWNYAHRFTSDPSTSQIWVGAHIRTNKSWSWTNSSIPIPFTGKINGINWWEKDSPNGNGACGSMIIRSGGLKDTDCVKHKFEYICMDKSCELKSSNIIPNNI